MCLGQVGHAVEALVRDAAAARAAAPLLTAADKCPAAPRREARTFDFWPGISHFFSMW